MALLTQMDATGTARFAILNRRGYVRENVAAVSRFMVGVLKTKANQGRHGGVRSGLPLAPAMQLRSEAP